MRLAYGIRIGPYLLLSSAREDCGGRGEETRLSLIKRDFRDVKLNLPWKPWLWPFRSWWIREKREQLAFRVSPDLARHVPWMRETLARPEIERLL